MGINAEDDDDNDFSDDFDTLAPASATVVDDPKISGKLSIEDFVAFPPNNTFIYLPCREHWSAAAIDKVLLPQQALDNNGQPLRRLGEAVMIPASTWLMRYRRVEQISWEPGAPMIIRDRLINGGIEWVEKLGANVLNTYKPPTLVLGDASKAQRWVDHWYNIYPNEADHIIKWLASRVQHPDVKINHAVLLGSQEQGVGKDTLLMGALFATGGGNYKVIEPKRLLTNYSNYVKHVILQISEIEDTATGDGEHVSRFSLYSRVKDLIAAPPQVLHYVDKYQRGYDVTNCIGVVMTSNHELGSIYIPDTDRRLFVAWTTADGKKLFSDQYWKKQFWDWYEKEGGYGHVAAYLHGLDISGFDPKARPPQTEAWKRMVRHDQPVEEDELADAIDALGNPAALVIAQLVAKNVNLEWMIAPKTLRSAPHRLGRCGYVSCDDDEQKDRGRWRINGRRHVIYVQRKLDRDAQRAAASALASKLETKKE